MDFPLEQDQESGQVEARCVSYHMFNSKFTPNTGSCFDLSFITAFIDCTLTLGTIEKHLTFNSA